MFRFRFILLITILITGFGMNLADDFFMVRKGIIDTYPFRFSFFYISPLLSLENAGYTSNIYRYNDLENPDWTADIGLNVRLAALLGKRFVLVMRDQPFYSFYLENKQEEAWNNKFEFAAYSYLGPFNVQFSLDRNNLRQLPSDEFGIRVRYRVSRERISIDYGNYKRFYINVYGEQSRTKYQNENYLGDVDFEQLLDQQQHQIGLKINRIIFSRTVLSINLEYFQYRFQNYSDRDGAGEFITLGLNFPEIGKVTGSFRIGYKFFQPENPFYRDYSTPFGSGEVKVLLLRRFRLSLEYLVDNAFSFYQPENYYNQRTVTGGIEFYLTRSFKLGYQYRTGLMRFKNLETGDTDRNDRIEQSRFFFGIKIFKRMGIGIEYTRYGVDTDLNEYSRSYDFIGGYITYDF